MAMFSQDDDPEEETPGMGSAFSGGLDPADGDEQTETPSPAGGDEQQEVPEVAEPDAAIAYARSPEEQNPDQGEAGLANQFSGGDDEGGQYSQSAAPVAGAPVAPAGPIYGDWSADRGALEQQYAKEAAQNVKPSIGRRILAGLAGAATTFGGGNGSQVVQNVLNRPAEQAKQGWQRQETPLKQQLTNDAAQDAETQRTYQGQRQAANDAALNDQRQEHAAEYKQTAYEKSLKLVPVDPANKFGEWQQVDPTGKVVARGQEPPAAIKNDPDYQAYRTEKTISDAEKSGHPFTTEQQQILRGGGKLTNRPAPIPRQPAAGEAEYQDWKTAFQRDNKRPPNAGEIASYRTSGAAGGGSDPETLIQNHVAEKQGFADQWQRVDAAHASAQIPEGSYVPADADLTDVKTGDFKPTAKNMLTGQQFADKIDQFRTKLNASPAMRKAGTMLDDQGNVVTNRFAAPAQRQTAPAAPQQAPRTMVTPKPAGLRTPGNIPIDNRPTVQNADGSHSSEYSVSFQDKDGSEVLVPTVVNGKFLTLNGQKPPEGSVQEKQMFQAAWQNYLKTGQHLGKFDNPQHADAYASALHNRDQQTPQVAPKTFSNAEIPKNVPLPPNNVWVKAPNGVVGHIPQANLQKAIARGYAVPGGQ